ncbi:hypothetical protein TWF506_004346 [Arthrobotrys conoides]|uniref:Uncharacterized protein n=1 Tax=Arthrobotrys conoides TaxID=74498 RepID=A0AAN8NBK5_9PEZI
MPFGSLPRYLKSAWARNCLGVANYNLDASSGAGYSQYSTEAQGLIASPGEKVNSTPPTLVKHMFCWLRPLSVTTLGFRGSGHPMIQHHGPRGVKFEYAISQWSLRPLLPLQIVAGGVGVKKMGSYSTLIPGEFRLAGTVVGLHDRYTTFK